MDCEDVVRLVDASIDGQLDFDRDAALAAHLRSCASCSSLFQSERQMRTAIRRQDLYFRAPSELHQRIRQDLRDARRGDVHLLQRRRPASRPSLAWFAAAAALILVAAASTWLLAPGPAVRDILTQQVVAAHIRSLLPGHLTDVPSTDQHTVKPWFAGRVNFSPPVADFAPQGYPLVGGRVDYLAGRTVAVLVYKRRQHVINEFVWPADNEAPTKDDTSRGYHVMAWTGGGLSYALVSDLNETELRQFADMLRR